MTVDLPDETKETFLNVLQEAASKDRSIIEFTMNDGTLYAKELTEHVEKLEEMNE